MLVDRVVARCVALRQVISCQPLLHKGTFSVAWRDFISRFNTINEIAAEFEVFAGQTFTPSAPDHWA